jgi:hypothetical protein
LNERRAAARQLRRALSAQEKSDHLKKSASCTRAVKRLAA